MSGSPTSRSLEWYRERGWIADVVEKYLPYGGVKRDVWGFGDLLVAHGQMKRIALVQTTTKHNLLARKNKILSDEAEEGKEPIRLKAMDWLQSGGEIHLQGWRKVKGDWEPVNERLELSAFL